MGLQDDEDVADALYQALRAGLQRTAGEKTPLDSVPELETKPQNTAENSGTVYVPISSGTSVAITREECAFLEYLSEGCPVLEACTRSGVARSAAYRRRHSDLKFEKLWNNALDMAADRLEEEADRRGFSGWEESVYYKGSAVGVRKRYSDRMLMFRLRALKPCRYGNV